MMFLKRTKDSRDHTVVIRSRMEGRARSQAQVSTHCSPPGLDDLPTRRATIGRSHGGGNSHQAMVSWSTKDRTEATHDVVKGPKLGTSSGAQPRETPPAGIVTATRLGRSTDGIPMGREAAAGFPPQVRRYLFIPVPLPINSPSFNITHSLISFASPRKDPTLCCTLRLPP